jgi:hypothetical protein
MRRHLHLAFERTHPNGALLITPNTVPKSHAVNPDA